MRNKGAIWTLAIALTAVCLYQLSFTFIAAGIRNHAKEIANGNEERYEAYLDSLSNEEIIDIGIKSYTFREVQELEMNMGLDLKGGMNLILEVSVEDIVRSMGNPNDTTFSKAIALAKEMQKESPKDFITLFGEAFEEIDPDANLSAIFTSPELRDMIEYGTPNDEVLEIVRQEAQGAIDNAFNIIRTRIDQFGVTQPNIQRLESNDRILVDLPGVKNKDRVKNLLQGTANLEFWETYENAELLGSLEKVNEMVYEYNQSRKGLEVEDADTVLEDQIKADELAVEDEKSDTTTEKDTFKLVEPDTTAELFDLAASDTVQDGANDIENKYPLFRMLSPSADPQTGEPYPGAIIGRAHYSDTAKINFYIEMAKEKMILPPNAKFLWSAIDIRDPETDKNTGVYSLYAIKVTTQNKKAPLDGDAIVSASQEFDQQGGNAYVMMNMNGEGAKKWARLTKKNEKKVIAVVLDDRVYSGPVVQQEITGGSSQITGNFSINEAQDLANLLESGRLPAPARIIQENIVGPSLGKKAVEDGFTSFIFAFALVLLYMLFYYSRRAGWVADIALVANMFFIAGVLASLGASLTLPGIAGIVLTIGMSVDANVLIFERIREEIAAGKGVRIALSDGYKNAYSAIIDANVTSLITGIILYIFGTGPIKGFATTLVIGICTSLFSAIFITRLIFDWYLKRNKDIKFDTKITRNLFKNLNIEFLAKRKTGYVISTILILISIVSLAYKGLDQGVDFTGGRNYIIKFEQAVNNSEIAEVLGKQFGNDPKVITFGDENQVRITTRYRIDEEGTEIDEEIQKLIYEGLLPIIGSEVDYDTFFTEYWQSNQKVGPTIADDIKRQAVIAIFLALLFMFLYILLRFRNWQYGMGAIAALSHDSLIVLGVFSLLWGIMPFSLEIDQAFIAAILTVVGYSVNDTVVVFDRVREFIGIYPKRNREEIMNKALNSTLSRTFSTSLSTFVVLLAIFLFGGEVIRGFVFALLIGIIVGTYSSLFIATPIAYDSILKREARKKKK